MVINIFKIVAVVFFLTGVQSKIRAQDMSIKAGKILDLCYEFKLNSADSLLSIYTNQMKTGEEVELSLLKANIYWWKIITGINDKTTKNNYYKILESAEKYFNKELDKGYSHYYKGISLYGYMARMDGLNKNYIKAFFRINNCLKYLEKSFDAETKYPFFYLSSGLYNYHIIVTSKQYPVLIPYLSLYPKGNREKGLGYLRLAAAHNNKFLSTEANYFLMKIYLEEQNFTAALIHSNELLKRFPQNPIFLYYQFKLMLMLGNKEKAQSIFGFLKQSMSENSQVCKLQLTHFQNLMNDELKNYKQQNKSK